jgi:hypothetical protein
MSAAAAMRDLPLSERNALIAAAGDKVLDIRQELAKRIKQRILAEGYRTTFRPKGRPHAS